MGWGGGGARLAPNFALLCFVSCCARCGGLRVIPLLACSDFPKIQQGHVTISEHMSMDSVAQWLRRWSDPNIGCLRQLVGQHQLIQVRVLAESSNTWARGMAGTIMHRQLQSKEGPNGPSSPFAFWEQSRTMRHVRCRQKVLISRFIRYQFV